MTLILSGSFVYRITYQLWIFEPLIYRPAPSSPPIINCFNSLKLSISPVEARIASNWLWFRCYHLFQGDVTAHLMLERLNSCLQAVVISQTSFGERLLLISFLENNMREQMCNDLSDFLDKAVACENRTRSLSRDWHGGEADVGGIVLRFAAIHHT